MNTTIAFIGGGNMAISLISGLLNQSLKPEQILVAEPDANKRAQLEEQYAVKTTNNNVDCIASDVVILAVKPQILQQVCRDLAPHNPSACLFISIAAGIISSDINRWLGDNKPIVRTMPNTPALVGLGATALFANHAVNAQQKNTAEQILRSVGISLWVSDESEIDAVTAVSGSGPAYFFLMMEAMHSAGVSLGLSDETAKQLTLQTALGAASMANSSDVDLAELRLRVTSKGGTTEQAILSFENDHFSQIVKKALQAAHDRSQSLADELGVDI